MKILIYLLLAKTGLQYIMAQLFLCRRRLQYLNDEWCTAPGSDFDTGITDSGPKASVHNVLSEFDLEPGDIVLIDTGNYNILSTIVITENDEGSMLAPVTFKASPYGVL